MSAEEDRKITLRLRLPKDLHEYVKERAKQSMRTMNAEVQYVLREQKEKQA